MSAGCAIVASDTKPLHELIEHEKTGLLVDFFDYQALADQVSQLLDDEPRRVMLGVNARKRIESSYDLNTVCLPKQIEWVEQLANSD
jgi:glycosyltransferase involved in cell wall biosynthesis